MSRLEPKPEPGCQCAWSHFPDYGGWRRTTTELACPTHGHEAADRRPIER